MAAASLLLILIAIIGSGPATMTRRDSTEVHIISPSVGWMVTRLDTIAGRVQDANDEYMSLGPSEDLPPDTTTSTSSGLTFRLDDRRSRKLRVTIGSSERITWARIDDVTIGRADSRSVRARWMLDRWAYPPVSRLLAALPAGRVRAAEPAEPIQWTDPHTFRWVTSTDTLVVRQLAGPLFRLEMRLVQ